MAEKQKKPIFKRWWFWVVVAVVVIGIASQGGDDTPKLSGEQDQQKLHLEQKPMRQKHQNFLS